MVFRLTSNYNSGVDRSAFDTEIGFVEGLTVQDSEDEQPHVEQSTRASRSLTFAGLGLAMASPASRVRRGIENFILEEWW